jgi:exodeoxyribonuclease VII small subunit
MAKKNETFEDMMKKLEEITSIMDNEQLTLEQSMKYYEQGIQLCNKLYKSLNDAEQKIKLITNNKEEDFMLKEE